MSSIFNFQSFIFNRFFQPALSWPYQKQGEHVGIAPTSLYGRPHVVAPFAPLTRKQTAPTQISTCRFFNLKSSILNLFCSALLILSLFSTAQTQTWTVQVAAYTNEADAVAEMARLEPHQLGHYAERSDGFIRVRVGCFTEVETAQGVAEQLGSLGFDTSLAPLTAGLRERRCVGREVGFVTPERWGLYEQGPQGASFWLQLGMVRGFIAYTQNAWRLSQTPDIRFSAVPPNVRAFYEREGVVFHDLASPLRLTNGQLLWQNSDTALILEQDKVSAYRVFASQNALN